MDEMKALRPRWSRCQRDVIRGISGLSLVWICSNQSGEIVNGIMVLGVCESSDHVPCAIATRKHRSATDLNNSNESVATVS
jgi:hypothetical protein